MEGIISTYKLHRQLQYLRQVLLYQRFEIMLIGVLHCIFSSCIANSEIFCPNFVLLLLLPFILPTLSLYVESEGCFSSSVSVV